jgi:hypothetical protein
MRATEAKAIVGLVRGLGGRVHVAFEDENGRFHVATDAVRRRANGGQVTASFFAPARHP